MAEPTQPGDESGVEARAVLTVIAAWLVPGAGHFALGRRGLALAFCLIVAVGIALGLLLDGNLHQIVAGRPLTLLFTLASMGMGMPYFLMRYGAGYAGDVMSPGYEYGSAFLITAGLMNLLLVLDVWDRLRGRRG